MTINWIFYPVREFDGHQDKWREISLVVPANPLLSYRFVSQLVKHFASGDELIAVCRKDGVAVAMTILQKMGLGKWQTFQPGQGPVGVWLQHPELSIQSLLQSLLKALPGFALVVGITRQDPELLSRPVDSEHISTLDFIQTARVLINRSFDEYWKARDSKLRQETNRRIKRVRASGIEPRVEVITDPAAVAGGVRDFGQIESAGWKGREGTAVHADNNQGHFYKSLLESFCGIGKGRIYRYWIGDNLAAMQFCVEKERTIVFLKTTYDENLKSHGPGILMQYEIMKQLFEEGRIDKVEFYGKTGEPQAKWCDNQIRTMYHVNCYRWPWLPKMMEGLRAVGRRPNRDAQSDGETQVDGIGYGPGHTTAQNQTYSVTLYKDLFALPSRVESLFSRVGNISLFFTLPWYKNFVEMVLAPDEHLRIYAVETAKPLMARALLLMRHYDSSAGLLSGRVLIGLSSYYTSLFGPLIEPDESDTQAVLDALAAAIKDDEPRWDVIDLHPLAIDTPVFQALVNAFKNSGLLAQTYFCFGNWYLRAQGRSYTEYFNALPSRLVNTIRKKKEQLENSVKSRVIVYQDLASLDEALHAYEKVYAASWKELESNPEFIRSLCRACAASGWLRLGVIYVDEQPVAAQIWIVHAGVAAIYKLAYDKRFAQLSPGTLLTAHLMEHVMDVDKVREVDFLTGDDEYKKDWMSDRRERWGIVAFNTRTPRGLLAFSRHVVGRTARRAINLMRHFPGTGN
jgi:hypothetical protein